MVKKIKNSDKGFYGYMGKIFGSRAVQRETNDRFYDDDGKDWILSIYKGAVVAVVSVKGDIIKNVYAEDTFALMDILSMIYPDVCGGTVPICYKEIYAGVGYRIAEEKKNFLKIVGGKNGKN